MTVPSVTQPLGVFQDFRIDGRIAAVRDHGYAVLELVVVVPHPATVTNDVGH